MLLKFPFRFANIEKIGRIFYPVVNVSLRTVDGWKEFGFVVDTGADVTVIPSSFASVLNLDLSQLGRSVVIGVGGVEVTVRETFLPVKLGDLQLKIRVNITDGGSSFLLGKKDVFENAFSLRLDSIRKVTILERN